MTSKNELSGIASATRQGLARRALWAARRVESWVKFLEGELEKQGGCNLRSPEEYNAPVTLKRRDAVHLIGEMSAVIADIRKLIQK